MKRRRKRKSRQTSWNPANPLLPHFRLVVGVVAVAVFAGCPDVPPTKLAKQWKKQKAANRRQHCWQGMGVIVGEGGGRMATAAAVLA